MAEIRSIIPQDQRSGLAMFRPAVKYDLDGSLKPLANGQLFLAEMSLEIAFDTRELRDQCENEDSAVAAFGVAVAKSLKNRLADLRATPTIGDLPSGFMRCVGSASDGRIEIALSDGYAVSARSNHVRISQLQSAKADWSKISRICILAIGQQHAR